MEHGGLKASYATWLKDVERENMDCFRNRWEVKLQSIF
jgi:hypothetical protein